MQPREVSSIITPGTLDFFMVEATTTLFTKLSLQNLSRQAAYILKFLSQNQH